MALSHTNARIYITDTRIIYDPNFLRCRDFAEAQSLKSLNHPQVVPVSREQGERYRRLVIGRGSSVDEMRLIEDFLGRKPSAAAMYAALELEV